MLDTITKKDIKLSHDLVVYKMVVKRWNGLFTPYYNYKISNKKIHVAFDGEQLISEDGKWYSRGFHSFVNPIEYLKVLSAQEEFYSNWELLEFTIPKGTIVTYGIESGLKCIVSQIIVFNGYKESWYVMLWNKFVNFIRRIF